MFENDALALADRKAKIDANISDITQDIKADEADLMKLLAADLGRGYEVFPCAPNPRASYWFQGKAYGVIYPQRQCLVEGNEGNGAE